MSQLSVAKYCDRIFRCVKCTATHEPGKCPLNLELNEKKDFFWVQYVGCGEVGHPAFYIGCPKIKEAISKIKKLDDAKLQRLNKINRFIRADLPYSGTLKPNSSQYSHNQAPSPSLLHFTHKVYQSWHRALRWRSPRRFGSRENLMSLKLAQCLKSVYT